MTPAQCRAKADEMDAVAATAKCEIAVLEWEAVAQDWRRLAAMAEAQTTIQAELNREVGRPDDAPL